MVQQEIRSRLMGVDIDSLTREQFLARIDTYVQSRQPHQITYLNADCLNKCSSDRAYREAILQSDLVYADGMSVVWASRLFGYPLPERVNANDLIPEFCRRAEQKGYRLFLLGGEEGVAERTAAQWVAEYPGLQICGCHSGFFSVEEEVDVLQVIQAAQPDILIVGMGAPKQELWIQRNGKTLGIPVSWGVGGLLDYSAKGIARAPVWMRQCGMEWFWRLCMEPKRLWKRYVLGNILFTFRVGFLIFTDAILVSVAWFLAYFMRSYWKDHLPGSTQQPLNPIENYVIALPVIVLVWIILCASLDLYRRQFMRTAFDELTAIVKMSLLFMVTSMAAAFLMKGLDPSRYVLILCSLLAFVFLLFSRVLLHRMEKNLYQEGIGRIRALFVGTSMYAKNMIKRLQNQSAGKYEILGILDEKRVAGDRFMGQPVLGKNSELAYWVDALRPDEIFFTDPDMKRREILNLVVQCGNSTSIRQFNILTDMFGMITDRAYFSTDDDFSFKVLRQGGLSPLERICKRMLDISIASFLLILSLPFLPIICFLIRLSSPGPAIFKHERIGKDGRPLVMYKFRTMYREVNEYEEAPIRKDDPRIIPIGRFLRRTSLDELPQLWNVLKGEMSMVGPRPEMQFIVNQYEPWQKRRLSVLPGITGLWQISGRKDLPLHANLEYDFYYIQNQSLLFDLIILLETVPVVLFGKGAY
jgi:exopolysaccharide biosynthesis polyprenyl glycosylphosphotransferase